MFAVLPLHRSAIDGTCPEICTGQAGTGRPTPGCSSHDQCDDGYYCDTFDDCYECSYCVTVHNDAYDGTCPDTCASFSTQGPLESTVLSTVTARTAAPIEATSEPSRSPSTSNSTPAPIRSPTTSEPSPAPTTVTSAGTTEATSAAADEECPRNCGTLERGGGICRPSGRCLACNENRLRVNGRCVQSLSCRGRRVQTGSLSGQGCQCLQEHCHFCTRVVSGDTCRVSSNERNFCKLQPWHAFLDSQRAFFFSGHPPPQGHVRLTYVRYAPQHTMSNSGLSRRVVSFELGVC